MMNRSTTTGGHLARATGAVRGVLLVVVMFSFTINALMLTVPLYMLQIYDRVLTSRSHETLIMLSVLALGLLLTVGVLEFARSRVLVRVGGRIDGALNTKLFENLFSRRSNGGQNGAQALRDLETVRHFLTGSALIALIDAPWTPFFIAIIFLLHPYLGLVALGGSIILFTHALTSEFVTRRPLGAANKESVDAAQFAESGLRNAEAVVAMGMTPGLMRRWAERHEESLALQAIASDRSGALTASVKFFRPMIQVVMLGVGAWLAVEQVITAGVMIGASIIMGRALAPVEAAIGSWRNFVNSRDAYARLRAALEEVGDDAEKMELPTPTGEITVENLVAAPPGAPKPVLQRVSFDLSPGEILGVVGPSGAGKSTLARLLVGIWQPLGGRVALDGADIYSWDRVHVGAHIGYLSQSIELFDGTVVDNIARFNDADPEKVVQAAQAAGVHELILRLPDGYDTEIGPGGNRLSGGQQQRIALARALYGNPAFVVLDEPNANLDSPGEAALNAAIGTLKAAGTTVVIIAHRASVLTHCDKLLVLKDGQVDKYGPADEIMGRILRPETAGSDETANTGAAEKSQKSRVAAAVQTLKRQ